MRNLLTIALYSLDTMTQILCNIGENRVAHETDAGMNKTLEAECNFMID